MKRLPLLVFSALMAMPAVGFAAVKEDARFALHRKAPTTKATTTCTTYSPNTSATPCTQYGVTAPLLAYSLVYMVIGQGPTEGINGCSFGIDYEGRSNGGALGDSLGIDPAFNTFTVCADGLTFHNNGGNGDFPAPKGGTRITWIACQNADVGGIGTHAVIGALSCYATAEDVMRITPNNNIQIPELAIATCAGQTVQFLEIIAPSLLDMAMGRVHFGGTGVQGFTPCGVVPAKATTWGKVKALY